MKCLNPKQLVHGAFAVCGYCRFCRIQAQKVWATRILLESYFHPRNTFITLTYSDDSVPLAEGVPVLHKPDVTRFIERLRYRVGGSLRYFAVGEYGSQTWRPHYHLVLFGQGVDVEPHVNDAWTSQAVHAGFTQVGELTFDRAMYIANYTVKKMTRPDDEKLKGRPPEFSRMSTGRRVMRGIGAPAVGWLADTMARGLRCNIEKGDYGPMLRCMGDVFNTVRIEGKIMPLGRYIRRQLRDALGLSQDARERAIQLGRFDASTGEIYDENLPREWCPDADLTDINTPWRRQREYEAQKARQLKINKLGEKGERQQTLNLTTGGRV